jgi:hypothetical protein
MESLLRNREYLCLSGRQFLGPNLKLIIDILLELILL